MANHAAARLHEAGEPVKHCNLNPLGTFGTGRGFTIVELLVALGLTLVLVIGIGRIFTISKDTMSVGEANANISQSARAIERIMREDFRRITREGFLVIRNERMGLPSNNPRQPGALSAENQRDAIFFDREAQEKGTNLLSRPVGREGDEDYEPGLPVVRLDQIAFFTNGEYSTYQYPNSVGVARNLTAGSARVWYGHAFRSRDAIVKDTSDDDDDGNEEESVPTEIRDLPQIEFNAYRTKFADPSTSNADNANYFAKDWMLARQGSLLSAWYFGSPYHYSPSYAEFFNEAGSADIGTNYYGQSYFRRGGYNAADGTGWQYRQSPGYVDLIDMDLSEVQKAVTEYGLLYNPQTSETDEVLDPLGPSLWQEGIWTPAIGTSSGFSTRAGSFLGPVADADDEISGNPVPVLQFVTDPDDRSAIGDDLAELWAQQQRGRMLLATGRIRAETVMPTLSRQDQMLSHAVLGVAVTSFEVAWSTGEISYPDGELVWYDIENPANPYYQNSVLGTRLDEARRNAPGDPRTWYLSEVTNQQLPPGGPLSEAARPDLYYATFGYFIPKAADADRSELWPWPTLIRIRMTLHDEKDQIPGGRTFEFIFSLPGENTGT